MLFCRLQKHEMALQLRRSTSIYVDMACYLLICIWMSWKISQLIVIPIISHTPGTVGLSFDLLVLSHVEDTPHPVP